MLSLCVLHLTWVHSEYSQHTPSAPWWRQSLPVNDRALLASLTDGERHSLACELQQRAHWHDKLMCFRISVRKALRDREEEARKAIIAELGQMLTMKVWHGVRASASLWRVSGLCEQTSATARLCLNNSNTG